MPHMLHVQCLKNTRKKIIDGLRELKKKHKKSVRHEKKRGSGNS